MDSLRKALTNERLSKKFNSSFELVNYAIKLAENIVKTGRNSAVKTYVQNPAYWALLEIVEDKDAFQDLVDELQDVKSETKESLAKKVLEKESISC